MLKKIHWTVRTIYESQIRKPFGWEIIWGQPPKGRGLGPGSSQRTPVSQPVMLTLISDLEYGVLATAPHSISIWAKGTKPPPNGKVPPPPIQKTFEDFTGYCPEPSVSYSHKYHTFCCFELWFSRYLGKQKFSQAGHDHFLPDLA